MIWHRCYWINLTLAFVCNLIEQIAKLCVSQWPYTKPSKKDADMSSMDMKDREYHNSFKPSWGPSGTLVYSASGNPRGLTRSTRRGPERDGLLVVQKSGIVCEGRDVRFASFSNEVSKVQSQASNR